jgi:hypothetical protein
LLAACSGAHTPPPGQPVTLRGPDAGPALPRVASDPICKPAAPKPAEPAPDAGEDYSEQPGRLEKPDDPKEVCATADSNLTRVEGAILDTKRPPGVPAAASAWDGKKPPRYLDAVQKRFDLSPAELAAIGKNGFAVLDRLNYPSFGFALHDVYESEIPLYVSMDALLDAIYAAHESLLANLERERLAPMVAEIVTKMTCSLPVTVASAGWPREVARDLDVYLTVARSLLDPDGKPAASMFGSADPTIDPEVKALVAAAMSASELAQVSLFGRDRMIDWTQFAPRAHYQDDADLAPYFRAAMWLSRLELNLVSRSSRSSQPGDTPDPSETPREDLDAMALVELAGSAGVLPSIDLVDDAWSLLAGVREDVSFRDLGALRAQAKIASLAAPDAAAKLRAAIGDGFQRTQRTHYMPEARRCCRRSRRCSGPASCPTGRRRAG